MHALELKSTMKIVTANEPRILTGPDVVLCAYMQSMGARTVLLKLEWMFGG